MDRPAKRQKADEEAEEDGIDACAALSFHLLQPGGDVEAASFHPEMCHQVFGDDERIHGWSEVPGCQLKIWLSQTNYESMLEVHRLTPTPTPFPSAGAETPMHRPPFTPAVFSVCLPPRRFCQPPGGALRGPPTSRKR